MSPDGEEKDMENIAIKENILDEKTGEATFYFNDNFRARYVKLEAIGNHTRVRCFSSNINRVVDGTNIIVIREHTDIDETALENKLIVFSTKAEDDGYEWEDDDILNGEIPYRRIVSNYVKYNEEDKCKEWKNKRAKLY